MVKLDLTIGERIAAIHSLPGMRGRIVMRVVDQALRALQTTEELEKKFNVEVLRTDDGGTTIEWNHKLDYETTEVDLPERALSLMYGQLLTMAKKKKIGAWFARLMDKIEAKLIEMKKLDKPFEDPDEPEEDDLMSKEKK